jgi:hypothetical protein
VRLSNELKYFSLILSTKKETIYVEECSTWTDLKIIKHSWKL